MKCVVLVQRNLYHGAARMDGGTDNKAQKTCPVPMVHSLTRPGVYLRVTRMTLKNK